MPPAFIILGEATLPRFLLSLIRGETPEILAVAPLLPWLRAPLDRLAAWAKASGRARDAGRLAPGVAELKGSLLHYHDVFGRAESWHDAHFRFDAAEARLGALAMAYKHATCNDVVRHFRAVLILDAIARAQGCAPRVDGADPDLLGLFAAFAGLPVDGQPVRAPRRLINAVTALMVMAYCLGWMARRIRLAPPPAEAVFLAADFLKDPRDYGIYDDAAEGGTVLLVMRNRDFSTAEIPELAPYATAHSDEGWLGVGAALSSLGGVAAELWRLWRFAGSRSPTHFGRLATLPHKRLKYRALFARFRPAFFFGRDDYNTDHILRRQELVRLGGRSLGVNHSIPNVACIQPMWRYISFDTYYVFGRWVYETFYKSTWAADMEVRAVGSFGFTRDMHRRFREAGSRPKDVVVFTDNSAGLATTLALVRGLAEALPDRDILLQVRGLRQEANRAFVAACTEGLGHVRYCPVPAYELLPLAGYAVSDASAVVVEAIQAGLVTYFMDMMPVHPSCMFRPFPDLVVTSAAQVAERIRAHEDGTHPYPREKFGGLVDLTGRVYLDEIRKDLGLAAK
ncbi:hypothetical protein CU669_00200 [Paramagnetospirillum kuznetsovii]|uniref:Uncharacterized protein n=1 Tax=Paramagnetospirillum kuznetsovii TaxID=2053833 RepID=A0A364P2K5_9PROT|nr:hypothetical protein [Paramagnetospirillum kuznetsovii]RAU23564.1 hypothetical protein CU669_00200 [Paramagnetospirillum kuznetsovii]